MNATSPNEPRRDRGSGALRRPHRAEARRHRAELRGCSTRPARGWPGCCAAGRRGRATASAIMLPNVPYFPAAYYGALRLGGDGRPDERPAQGARGRASTSTIPRRRSLFAWHDFAEAAQEGAQAAGTGTECVLVKPGEFEQLLAGAEPVHEVAERDGRRHRRDPLHVGHDGHAEGRRAHARQPAPQRRARRAACSTSARTTSSWARCRCSTPSARRAGSTPASRRRRTADARSRASTPARRWRSSPATASRCSRACPTMYAAMLNHPDADGGRHVEPAGVRLGRRRDAGRGHARRSRRSSAAWSSRATA